MSGKIGQYEIFTEEAIKATKEMIDNVVKLIAYVKDLSNTAKNATGLADIANETKKSADALSNFTEVQIEQARIQKLLAKQREEDSKYNEKEYQDQIKINNLKQKEKAEILEQFTAKKKLAQATKEQIAAEKQLAQIKKLDIQINERAAGTVERLRLEYQKYGVQMRNLNVAIPAQKAAYESLVKSQNAAAAQIEKLNAKAVSGGRGMNMLAWNMQQVGRELPSLAYGTNVFIGAISNNLPLLFDEMAKVKRVNAEIIASNKELVASGAITAAQQKKVIPLWKQMGAAIFSWQTALVAAVTIFTLYGKEMIDFIGNAFKGKKSIDALRMATEQLNEVSKKGTEDAQEELITARLLYEATQNQALSQKERLKAVNELQQEYPDYLGNLSDEDILAGKAATAYYNLANSILATAKAQAAREKMVENEKKILELDEKIAKAAEEAYKLRAKGGQQVQELRTSTYGAASDVTSFYQAQAAAAEGLYDTLNKEQDSYIAANKALADTITVESLITGKDPKDKKHKDDRFARAKSEYEAAIALQEKMLADRALNEENSLENEFARDEELLQYKIKMYNDLTDLAKKYGEDVNDVLKDKYATEADLEARRLKFSEDVAKRNYDILKERVEAEIDSIYAVADEKRIQEAKDLQFQLLNTKLKEDQKQGLIEQSAINMMSIEAEAINEILKLKELSADKEAQFREKLHKLEEDLLKKGVDLTEKSEKEKQAIRKETFDKSIEIVNQGFEFASAINERQMSNNEKRFKHETELAGANLEEQAIAEVKYNEEKRKLQRRAAIADKALASFNIILSTSKGVMDAASKVATVPLIPYIIGIGALSLATALAAPIPQFEKGGLVKTDQIIAGEKGHELAVTPSGQMMLTPATPTLISGLPMGTEIIPAQETAKMLAQQAYNQVYDIIDMKNTNSILKDIRDKESVEYQNGYKIVRRKGFVGKYKMA